MDIPRMLGLAGPQGAVVDDLVVLRAEDRPTGPSHRWAVVTSGERAVIGGFDRGEFAPYAGVDAEPEGAQLLASVTAQPALPALPRPHEQLTRAAQDLAETLRRSGDLGASIPVSSPWDHIGNESGHCLFAFGTPFSQRSLPPDDLNEPRTGYVLMGPLPATCGVEYVEPWFGQPGGGLMIRLDRVIRYYCDTGLLQRFAVDHA